MWIHGETKPPSCGEWATCGKSGDNYWETQGYNLFDLYRYYLGPGKEVIKEIICFLDNGYGVTIRIFKMYEPGERFDKREKYKVVGGHALTVYDHSPGEGGLILEVTDSDDERSESYQLLVDYSGVIVWCKGNRDYSGWWIEAVEALKPRDSKAGNCGHSLKEDVKFAFVRKKCVKLDIYGNEKEEIPCRAGENGTVTFGKRECGPKCSGFVIPFSVNKQQLHVTVNPDRHAKVTFLRWEGDVEFVETKSESDPDLGGLKFFEGRFIGGAEDSCPTPVFGSTAHN